MIVRISTIAIPKARLADYFEYIGKSLVPLYTGSPGLHSIEVLERDFVAYAEITTISSWDSEDAMMAFFETEPFDRTPIEFAGIEFEPRIFRVLVSQTRNDAC